MVHSGQVHVEAHQLLILSLARIQPDDDVARKSLNREAPLGREPRDVSGA